MTNTERAQREQFVNVFLEAVDARSEGTHSFAEAEHAARLLLRHSKTHGNIQEAVCNGHPACSSPYLDNATIARLQDRHEKWCEKREAQIEKRITAILKPFGITPNFGGDPRGYTVKLFLPSGKYNTWGGAEEGYGVPQ